MKKLISLVLVFIFMVSLCSCGETATAMYINGTDIDAEVYGYYLSVVTNSPEYNETEDKDKAVSSLCAGYVAAKEIIKNYNIKLSAKDKVNVSSDIKVQWQLYSSFYKKYGVSKQTLCRMLEHEKLIDSLVISLYGEGGERAVKNNDVLSFFKQHYAIIKLITTDFRPGMEDSEIKTITDKYTSMRNLIKGGGDFASAAQQYPELVKYEDVEHIISSFDTSYPSGMLTKVLQMKNGDTQVLRYSNGIYLVQKKEATSYYNVYKDDCIIKMKKADILKEIEEAAKNYTWNYNRNIISKIESKAGL